MPSVKKTSKQTSKKTSKQTSKEIKLASRARAAIKLQTAFRYNQLRKTQKSSHKSSGNTHVLETENICKDYKKLLNEKRFDLIAIEFGKRISEIVPFQEKASYDNILIGMRPSKITHTGYLGQKVYEHIQDEIPKIPFIEIEALLKINSVNERLQQMFKYSQKYLIKPMMQELLKKSASLRQSHMNRFLNLHILDNTGKSENHDFITKELYQRLVSQGFMEQIRNGLYRTITSDIDNFDFPVYTPKKPGKSKPHATVLKVLEEIVAEQNEKQMGYYTIDEEYPLKIDGYIRPVRYDMVLFKNGIIIGVIEADGIQHNKYTPHFHRDVKSNTGEVLKTGEQVFKEKQEKDLIKNREAMKLCEFSNNKECLRIVDDFSKPKQIKQKILEWIDFDNLP